MFSLLSAPACIYVKQGLSPPFHLRDALKRWRGLSQDEIVAVIEKHFEDCRRFYTAGSGDSHFHMVKAAMHRALVAKHPRDHMDDEPERPRRRASGVRQIHNPSGIPDLFMVGRPARGFREPVSKVERPSGPPGYERAGDPIGQDDEADS